MLLLLTSTHLCSSHAHTTSSKSFRFGSATAAAPLPIILLLLLHSICTSEAVQRHKEIDENYQKLIPLSEFRAPCQNPHMGVQNDYGVVNGGLEKCRVFFDEQESMGTHEEHNYEKYKCKHLRVHATIKEEGKCECEDNWKGPICNEFNGCPTDYSLYLGVCTPNVCQHNGTLALGSSRIECICKAPWQGRWCERLACWRMAEKEFERRWRNHHDRCICADGYTGDECDEIVFCKNGELVQGKCQCAEGWKGEICDLKCSARQTCGASGLPASLMAVAVGVALASALFHMQQHSTSFSSFTRRPFFQR